MFIKKKFSDDSSLKIDIEKQIGLKGGRPRQFSDDFQ